MLQYSPTLPMREMEELLAGGKITKTLGGGETAPGTPQKTKDNCYIFGKAFSRCGI